MTWLKSSCLAALAGISLEVAVTAYASTLSEAESFLAVPRTLHTVWEVAFFVVAVVVVKHLGADVGRFVVVVLVVGALNSLFWRVVPDALKLSPRYTATEYQINLDTHEIDGRRHFDYPVQRGTLYKADDPALERELAYLAATYAAVGTQDFLFWQTGLAYGYYPEIGAYRGGGGVLGHMGLFFLVGPCVLAEAIAKACVSRVPLFLLVVWLWFAIRKSHVWVTQ